jgi:uncharacterized membrane protein YeaQ/YmgE (transglycosylase-associated protein family)
MSLLTSVFVGGLIGWLARMLAEGRPRLNMLTSVVVGALGASLCGWLVSPLVGVNPSTQDSFSMMAVALAVAGAISLLGVVGFASRLGAR